MNDCHDVCMESTGNPDPLSSVFLKMKSPLPLLTPKRVKAVKAANKDDTRDPVNGLRFVPVALGLVKTAVIFLGKISVF